MRNENVNEPQNEQSCQNAVSRSVFFELLTDVNVKYFSTESAGDFNWQGMQDKIKYSNGNVIKTENDELILIDGKDEYLLDFNEYIGTSVDEDDCEIKNSFFFLNSNLVVVLN
mgnify:CR=1 FL=1